MAFIKENKIFSLTYALAVLITLVAIFDLGFREAVDQIADKPERLRDVTFLIWENYSPSQHGYLVFYSLDDFFKGIAYSNHPTAYLLFMYLFFKLEVLIPILKMRLVVPFLEMASLAGVVFYIAASFKKHVDITSGVLAVLAVVFMASAPGFWISAARYNVDNPFPIAFIMLLITSFFIWKDGGAGFRVCISTLFFAIFCPIYAVLLGVALGVCSINQSGIRIAFIKLSIFSILFGLVIYFQPIVVSKAIGFSSSNSGWMFRSGLDGDLSYFSNAINSVIFPYYPRPLHIILAPALLLGMQLISWAVKWFENTGCISFRSSGCSVGFNTFLFLIFALYFLNCLFWPQAVSIHPYLYDQLLLGALCVVIVLNFFIFSCGIDLSRVWILIMCLFVSFNFQQIAQSKCSGCYYPPWISNK